MKLAIIAGDGIGPEVIAEAVKVLDAVLPGVEKTEYDLGARRYHATGDNRRAVAEGLQGSAKVISSAALIMVVVFSVFALTGVPQIKEIGVGLSVAIFLDATLVRLVLVPATMELMGDANWWLPKWLDRILPNADFESDTAHDESREPAAVA